jgi:hypothetical protein
MWLDVLLEVNKGPAQNGNNHRRAAKSWTATRTINAGRHTAHSLRH